MASRTIEEEAVGPQIRIDAVTRAQFWELQEQVNSISAVPSTFADFKAFLCYLPLDRGVVESDNGVAPTGTVLSKRFAHDIIEGEELDC